MQYVAVLVAAAAAYAFGAVWYMALAKPWMAAAGLTEEQARGSGPAPYIISAISAIVVAGMMRHVFVMSGLDTLGEGIMGGAGLGFFIAAPWIVTNVGFSLKPKKLMWIDGGYAAIGCTIMGVVLSLFI